MPGIGFTVEGEQKACVQGFATFRILDHYLSGVFETDPRQVMHRALQIPALFPIQLQESAGMLEDFLVGLQLDEELRDFGLDAAIAANVDLPAGIDTDHADI